MLSVVPLVAVAAVIFSRFIENLRVQDKVAEVKLSLKKRQELVLLRHSPME
jgi:hypothetical protein